ncbi:hypothetical protein EX30DRAFT_66860 [Ascodesmis nigricans]|uniref:Uncharacterized protein n=1 Tax=Ascodesmis nigricans TaxID=341454 RepID=A0A4S2MU17_9PEZI|nr:hypothetical protein EX30DRAFT_66860 [Ascodesmis nigricans]
MVRSLGKRRERGLMGERNRGGLDWIAVSGVVQWYSGAVVQWCSGGMVGWCGDYIPGIEQDGDGSPASPPSPHTSTPGGQWIQYVSSPSKRPTEFTPVCFADETR